MIGDKGRQKMYRLKKAVLFFIIGSFLLITATLISTILLPNLEQKNIETSFNINKHLSGTRHILLMSTYYELKYLKYQMDAFQRNILIQTNAPQKAIEHLEKRMEKDMANLAKGWQTLNSGNEYNNILQEIRKKTNDIKTSTSINNQEKLDMLEDLWVEGINKVNSKQTDTEEQFDKDQKSLVTLKQKIAKWKNYFTIFQIIGLLLIFASQFLEKTTIANSKE